MKQLFLMRHAKSSWTVAGLSDFERGLKPRGEKAAIRMGQFLQHQQLVPAHIVSSTAHRAKATAELVLEQFPHRPELELRDELYHALPKMLVEVIQETDDEHDSLLLVAHNPGLEELVFQWSTTYSTFTTSTIAHYCLSIDRWSDLEFKLTQTYENLWKPKELDSSSADFPTE